MNPRIAAWLALALALAAGIWLRLAHVHDPHRPTPNETAYLYDAAKLHDEGLGATRDLFAEYTNDPSLWAVAQPVRIGYILILDLAMKAAGTTGIAAGSDLSLTASILTLLLVAWLGIRFFNPSVGAIAAALCATAFTEIWLVRGTPEDGVFGLFALLEIWIACEIVRAPRRRALYIPFHLIGIWSILIKQSGVFVYGFCAAWLLGVLWFRHRALRPALWLVAAFVAGLGVVCGVCILFAGDPHTAWRVYTLSYISNPEAWSYNDACCFGPPSGIPFVLLLLSPLTFFLSLAGIAMLALPCKWGSVLTAEQRNYGGICALMAFGFTALFSFFPGMEVLRFITPGQGAVCLLGGIALWSLLALAKPRLSAAEYGALLCLVAAGVAIGMVRDTQVFDQVAIRAGTPELGAIQIRSILGL